MLNTLLPTLSHVVSKKLGINFQGGSPDSSHYNLLLHPLFPLFTDDHFPVKIPWGGGDNMYLH